MINLLCVSDGRGFVVEHNSSRYVVTAAHCLPHLPPALSFAAYYERTYAKLLAPLGHEPTVFAECVFVDPVSDIAVLGQPDNQAMTKEADAFDALLDTLTPFAIADFVGEFSSVDLKRYARFNVDPKAHAMMRGAVEVIALGGNRFECQLEARRHGPLWVRKRGFSAGMSGSPFLQNGAAIGVLVTDQGPHPRLAMHLPAWLATGLIAPRAPEKSEI